MVARRGDGDGGCTSRGLQLQSLLRVLTPGHWSLLPAWGLACGPCDPERGDVRSAVALGVLVP